MAEVAWRVTAEDIQGDLEAVAGQKLPPSVGMAVLGALQTSYNWGRHDEKGGLEREYPFCPFDCRLALLS